MSKEEEALEAWKKHCSKIRYERLTKWAKNIRPTVDVDLLRVVQDFQSALIERVEEEVGVNLSISDIIELIKETKPNTK